MLELGTDFFIKQNFLFGKKTHLSEKVNQMKQN